MDHLVSFLRAMGAGLIPHSGRTLISHLCGTYELLQQRGEREAVCVGGLFHSVYGTNALCEVLIPIYFRSGVQRLIGKEAEELVYRFCTISRPQCFLTEQIKDRDLIVIELANLQEQGENELIADLEKILETAR